MFAGTPELSLVHQHPMSKPYPHSDYYRDRRSERELCCDFPGDELLISGLHAMQMHFYNNGTNIEIPIVRVMNTAHFLAAYMFATTCSGDQLEYDALANDSLGRDRRLFKVAIIVLAAMLQRTEGFRARACRNMLLADRDPDFDEGVTLYDRFLHSAEKRFAEEDFLIDTSSLIARLHEKDAIIARQEQTIQSINNTLTDMNERLTQIYIGTQNNTTTNIGTQIINKNYYYPAPAPKAQHAQAEQVKPEPEDIEPVDTSFFCTQQFAPDIIEKNIRQAIQLASSKADACRRILALETYGYIVLSNVSDDRKAELINPFAAPKYTFSQDDFKNARRYSKSNTK